MIQHAIKTMYSTVTHVYSGLQTAPAAAGATQRNAHAILHQASPCFTMFPSMHAPQPSPCVHRPPALRIRAPAAGSHTHTPAGNKMEKEHRQTVGRTLYSTHVNSTCTYISWTQSWHAPVVCRYGQAGGHARTHCEQLHEHLSRQVIRQPSMHHACQFTSAPRLYKEQPV